MQMDESSKSTRKYSIEKYDKFYVIVDATAPVKTPKGNEYRSQYPELAQLICDDMNQYGSDPFESMSFVTFQASYTDLASGVTKKEIIDNCLFGYQSDWDIALRAMRRSEKHGRSGPSLDESKGAGTALDPIKYFGPRLGKKEITAYLNDLTIRTLISMQICGATTHSILVGYRLFDEKTPISTSSLASGILLYGEPLPEALYSESDEEGKTVALTSFFNNLQKYARFPDE